ncbi:MAG: hypothetical protein JF886_16145 [Candidatus Dormibacteraeota bacterium]|uniref:Uncharacterized protein n=1 Tax=Candidatus Aeolococcus gillhamiae TaxID=3127015 RepID=A0A934N586_9BACT|nr:hypothetical protein [Candidatus Dormibacteraeota bacterium]
MNPPDGPGAPPPPATPPAPHSSNDLRPAAAPTSRAPVAVAPRRRHRLATFLAGLLIGVLLGGAVGYFIFNGRNVSVTKVPETTPTASPSPSPSALSTATPTVVPAQTAVAAPQGVVGCPVATPTGQHHLGSPGGPGSGQSAASGLDFCGGGDATIPTGTSRFLTGNNWGLGIADSCPPGSSGQSGMNTVLTVNEIIPGGGLGPDTATEPGDWVDSGSVLMAAGGSYQLRVATVSPSCVWHIKIYPVGG